MLDQESSSGENADRRGGSRKPRYQWYQLSLGAVFELTTGVAVFLGACLWIDPTSLCLAEFADIPKYIFFSDIYFVLAAVGLVLTLLWARRGHLDLALLGTPLVLCLLYYLWVFPVAHDIGGHEGLAFVLQYTFLTMEWSFICEVVVLVRIARRNRWHLWLAAVLNFWCLYLYCLWC